MKVAVFGAGGVGAYLGGRLAQVGADVHLIARGDHLAALRESGLRVESVAGDFEVDLPATDDPAEVGPCDYVIFTVKSYDTEAAAADLGPLLGEGSAVISFQNGLDNERVIAETIGREHVMGGVARIFSTIGAPGVIEHTGGPTQFVFGELDGSTSARGERFLEICERAEGVDPELSADVEAAIWEKATLICAQAGMTATVRLPLGAIRSVPESWAMYRRIVEEVAAVGRAEGVDLPDDVVDRQVDLAAGLRDDVYSSLHYDMTHGKRMEVEALNGAVVRRAEAAGVDVPMNDAVYAILKPWAVRNG